MAIMNRSNNIRLVAVILCLMFVSTTGAAVPVRSAPTTGLRIDPPITQVTNEETVTLELWVDDVANLCRAELHLSYDVGLEVQDADPNRAGVQIEPGPVFGDDCTQWNEAADGQIHFVAQRGPTDEPFSGSGVAALVTFLVAAGEPGGHDISFDQQATQFLNCDGAPISVDTFADATIVLPPLLRLTGWVTREGWNRHERSAVIAGIYPAASPYEPTWWGSACTDVTGDFAVEEWSDSQPPPAFTFPVPPISPPSCTSWVALARLEFDNYLSECHWKCADGDTLDIGWHDLEGGDVNGDGCINILDITRIITDFGQDVPSPCYVPCDHCPPADPLPYTAPSSDLNGDCRVDILDLSQAAGNFGLCSNCPP